MLFATKSAFSANFYHTLNSIWRFYNVVSCQYDNLEEKIWTKTLRGASHAAHPLARIGLKSWYLKKITSFKKNKPTTVSDSLHFFFCHALRSMKLRFKSRYFSLAFRIICFNLYGPKWSTGALVNSYKYQNQFSFVYLYVCARVCVCMYVCVYVCICVCMCVHISHIFFL